MNRLRSSFKSHPYFTNVVGYTALFASADLIQQIMLGGKGAKTSLEEKVTTDPEKKGDRGPEEVDTREGTGVFQKIESRKELDRSSRWSRKGPEQDLLKAKWHTEMRAQTWPNVDWSQTGRVALIGFCFHANFNYNWLKGLERMWPGGGVKRVAGKVFLDQLIAAPITISAFYIGLSAQEKNQDPLKDWRDKFWTSYKTGVVYWSTMQAINFSLIPPSARTLFVGGIALIWTIFLCHFRQQRGATQINASTN